MPKNKARILADFFAKHRRMPAYSELLGLFGVKSKNAVFKAVGRLVEEGVVKKDISGRLIPGRYFYELPILGTVAAGFPSPAEEELVDTMSLDEYLMPNRNATYLFKVKGDSMMDAGIMDGDLALVERGRTPKDGDVVLAEVDREWTLKTFRQKAGKVWLEPANKAYKPIYPKEELKVPAVVVSVIRKYKK